MAHHHPQLNQHGELQHLRNRRLAGADPDQILDKAEVLSRCRIDVKKVPIDRQIGFNLFSRIRPVPVPRLKSPPSALSADVVNLNINASSTSRGETLLDTIHNLEAMHADMFVVRHAESGAPFLIARHGTRMCM